MQRSSSLRNSHSSSGSGGGADADTDDAISCGRGAVWVAVPLLCGFIMTVQADLNSKAGDLVGNPLFGTLVNSVGAVAGIAAVGAALRLGCGAHSAGQATALDLSQQAPRAVDWSRARLLLLGTGPLAAVSMSISCAAVPHTGVLSFNMCSTSGRLAVAGVVDHFGLLGEGMVKRMTLPRLLAACLAPAGLLVSYGGSGWSELAEKLGAEAFFLVLSAVSGAIWPVADTFLIRLDTELGPARKVDLGILVYLAGFLSVSLLILTCSELFGYIGGLELLRRLPELATALPLYIWVGGLLGTLQFYCSITVQKRTGTVGWLLGTMAGQLILSMLLDATGFLGFEERPVTMGKVLGSCLVLASTALVARAT